MRRPDRFCRSLAGLVLLFFPAIPARAELITLRPGFQHVLDRPDVNRISVGNPEIIEAQPLPRGDGILVVGKKEGETDLVVWEKGKKTGWKVKVREERVPLIDEVRSFVSCYPDLTVSGSGDSVVVSGAVPTPADRSLVESFARPRPNVLLRISTHEEKKTLLSYDLKIIEISKGETSRLGIRWPDSLGVKGTWSHETGSGATLALGTDFEARLNLLMTDGHARILANPRLVCESGSSASFLAGGEIPIVIVTSETRTVEWKTYGIILNISPKMGEGRRIRTQITAEISTIDHGSGSSEVPGFLTRRVATHFSTSAGETVMLSGLVKSEVAKDIARVPLLGQIPVLGELFKSRSFRENQSDLAIFITPAEAKSDGGAESALWDAKAVKEKDHLKYRLID